MFIAIVYMIAKEVRSSPFAYHLKNGKQNVVYSYNGYNLAIKRN